MSNQGIRITLNPNSLNSIISASSASRITPITSTIHTTPPLKNRNTNASEKPVSMVVKTASNISVQPINTDSKVTESKEPTVNRIIPIVGGLHHSLVIPNERKVQALKMIEHNGDEYVEEGLDDEEDIEETDDEDELEETANSDDAGFIAGDDEEDDVSTNNGESDLDNELDDIDTSDMKYGSFNDDEGNRRTRRQRMTCYSKDLNFDSYYTVNAADEKKHGNLDDARRYLQMRTLATQIREAERNKQPAKATELYKQHQILWSEMGGGDDLDDDESVNDSSNISDVDYESLEHMDDDDDDVIPIRRKRTIDK